MSLAVLFDMDGLLLDTERLARRCWQSAAVEHGAEISDEVYSLLVGRTEEDSMQLLREHLGTRFPALEVRRRCLELYEAAIDHPGPPVKDGAQMLIRRLQSHSVPLAVATSTRRTLAVKKLERAGLSKFFPTLACGDEISRGKPAPDIFLLAASRIGVDPVHCIVLEDSAAGLAGACAAGMRCIVIPDIIQPANSASAYAVVHSLRDVPRVLAALLPEHRE